MNPRLYRQAKFSVGQIVRHRLFRFRGVIFDVDPTFSNTEEWYQAIPAERRPSKDQPFYHLLAQNAEGGPYEAYVSKRAGDSTRLAGPFAVALGLHRYVVELRDPRHWRRRGSAIETEGPLEIVAPMPGKVVKVLVAEGEPVERGQGLLVIEAMKMQNELRAPRAGRIERVYMAEGLGVDAGARLIRLV